MRVLRNPGPTPDTPRLGEPACAVRVAGSAATRPSAARDYQQI